MTSWDFYSKFLHYNSFVYEKMYGKINHMVYQKVEELKSMCEKIEKYAKKYAEEYAEEEKIGVCISMCIKFNLSREETISELIQRFNITEEDAEEYYDEALQQQ